ncbi:MAG: hypothetical protein ACD_45C00006G0001, partial [uncultured bacterium]
SKKEKEVLILKPDRLLKLYRENNARITRS